MSRKKKVRKHQHVKKLGNTSMYVQIYVISIKRKKTLASSDLKIRKDLHIHPEQNCQ